jgi:two-component system, OmpR family, sensor histidine kinase BaeS
VRRDVPLRRSLLVRLLAVSALVSVCSIAATAWVVVRTTAVAIRQEQGQALADDAKVYDELLGYAASHPGWSGAGPTVDSLARTAGHRIVLMDGSRVLADSNPVPGRAYRPPQKPTAVVDPLSVDPQLLPAAASDGIDPRAVGPFRLSAADSSRLKGLANRLASCLRTQAGLDTQVVVAPSGRPRLASAADGTSVSSPQCPTGTLSEPTDSEQRALKALDSLVNACLARHSQPPVTMNVQGTWTPEPTDPAQQTGTSVEPAPVPATDQDQIKACVNSGRTQQLVPYVAPAARLYVSSPGRAATTFFDLSTGNKLRIAGGAALVLVVTFAVTTLAGVRLVRPLRALTRAAERMEDGDVSARVKVRGGDELGRLSAAFNAMSQRREQLEEVRRAMVSDVAHELRTPLSNIRGWLEAVEDGVVASDDVLVASLLEEALLLQHIIDDLRDLSAADAGELRLSKEPLDVRDVLAQTATAQRASAETAGVALRVAGPGDPGGAPERVRVVADPVRLRQVVGNLVSNAIRHTSEGGTVTLSARASREWAFIEVTDTGTGMTPDELQHVFDRFWRAEKSRSRQTGGSGLGLSIVRKLTEAHGGEVTATSTPGEGSTFTLRLPRPR